MSNQAFYKFPSIGKFRNIVKDVRHFDPARARSWLFEQEEL